MTALLDPSLPEELPAPTAELVIVQLLLEAFIASGGRKEGKRFLSSLGNVMEDRSFLHQVVPIRRSPRGEAAARAEREAVAALRQITPLLRARLPSD